MVIDVTISIFMKLMESIMRNLGLDPDTRTLGYIKGDKKLRC